MNRWNPIYLSLGFIAALAARSLAQEEPPPAPPVLSPVGDMKWTITVQPKEVSLPGIFNPWLLEYSRGSSWTRMVATCGQAEKHEYWLTHGYVLTRSGGVVAIQRLLSFIPPAPYATLRFFGVDQIKPSDDRGVTVFQGSRCRYFSNRADAGGYEAWFDTKTGLPKAYRKGSLTYLYEFSPAVPSEVQVPADFQAAFDRYLQNLRVSGLVPVDSH